MLHAGNEGMEWLAPAVIGFLLGCVLILIVFALCQKLGDKAQLVLYGILFYIIGMVTALVSQMFL